MGIRGSLEYLWNQMKWSTSQTHSIYVVVGYFHAEIIIITTQRDEFFVSLVKKLILEDLKFKQVLNTYP